MARHLHGRYTILGKLADGGMAEIFLAVQHGMEGFEKPVVLKRILTQYSADPQFRNMLLDEAHISMSLQHSNIVQVLDLGVAGGRYFLVLELVDGWDLERILVRAHGSSTVWPAALALYVATQVCRALAYAHNKTRDGKALGIVHRDISPNNVLISEQGEVKLADFGIAKAQRKREQTAAGVIKGKVAYMSPEQATGVAALDRRSDIFSVGSMLYRMMTDKLPFEAENDMESLLKVQKAKFAPPEELKPAVGAAVSSIIMRAMRLAPSERYQTADEMLADVERVLRTEFHSAGQTELKLWLEQLGRRDHAESIGKRRLDTSGVVKDILGTDLSAGTSFELDDLEQVMTGETEISMSPPTPPPAAFAVGAGAGGAAAPAGTGVVAPPRAAGTGARKHRFRGFWLGAFFALGAVLGLRYLFTMAQERGVADRLGLGADGAPRATGGGSGAPEAKRGAVPEPVQIAPAPAAPPASPTPAAAAAPPPSTPAPPTTAGVVPSDAAADRLTAVAAAEQKPPPAAAAGGSAGGEKRGGEEEEPDEEALLRNAVPNAESEVIGEDEATAATSSGEGAKPAAAGPAKTPAPTKVAARTPAGKPAPPPASPPRPARPTIIVHIRSQPVGAVVRVKSRVLGRTPINLHFKSDNIYELTFVKRGYQPTTKLVTLRGPKDRSLAVALKKRPASKRRTFFHPHR